jgi:hypothetical protein
LTTIDTILHRSILYFETKKIIFYKKFSLDISAMLFKLLVQSLMEVEIAITVGAERYKWSQGRVNQRNGYRERQRDTRVGTTVPRAFHAKCTEPSAQIVSSDGFVHLNFFIKNLV